MDSAKLSVVHFNSEDVIATSGPCTYDHGNGSFLGKIFGIEEGEVQFYCYRDDGKKGDTAHDGIYTYYDYDSYPLDYFKFTPEVGKTFYAGVDEYDSDCYYECNGTHDNLVGGPNQ